MKFFVFRNRFINLERIDEVRLCPAGVNSYQIQFLKDGEVSSSITLINEKDFDLIKNFEKKFSEFIKEI